MKTIVITMGDPLGIGPEVIMKAVGAIHESPLQIVIIGSWRFFKDLPHAKKIVKNKKIHFIDLPFPRTQVTKKSAGAAALAALQKAVVMIKNGEAQALVTAPISKENVRLAGFLFPGHTEYLCHEFGVKKFAMMLFHERLRVVLTTIHLPLRNIFTDITTKNIVEKLELTTDALQRFFRIAVPKIAVCGLNPHAGENGVLGHEERKIITPAIAAFLKKNHHRRVDVTGPVSADTVFVDALQKRYDAVLCHYHDQGLIPIKSTGFGRGVNMTLGLPFPRTSPDHGTAFDIAGKGMANSESMMAAIAAARKMI